MTPGIQNSKVSTRLIQNLVLISSSCRYTARGGSKIARITNKTLLSLADLPALLSALNFFSSFLASLVLAFLSLCERLLNSAKAAFTAAGSGPEVVFAGTGSEMVVATAGEKATSNARNIIARRVKIFFIDFLFF